MKKCVVILSQKRQDSEFFKRLEKGIEVFYSEKSNYIALLSESVNEKNLKILIKFHFLYLLEKKLFTTIFIYLV